MKSVTILALQLGYGGIEKAIVQLANNLSDKFKVTIVSTYKMYEKCVFELNKNVNVIYLLDNRKPNKDEFIKAVKNFRPIKVLKEGIKGINTLRLKKVLMINYIKNCDSDYIISTRDIHNQWLSCYGKNDCVKIGWEHNHHNNNKKYIKKIINSTSNLDYFVLVSKELKEFYEKRLNNKKCHCVYIPNTINRSDKRSNLKSKNLISIGRLSKEKGFLDLIEVFAMVNKKFPDWKLNIIGDGREKEKLISKINDLSLTNNVILHGYQNTKYINNQLSKSSIFLMTSYTESFGIVVLEAFSYGIPVVAFSSAQGVNEIISDNWDGYIVKNRDKEQMARRVCALIDNYNRRFIMGNNAYKKMEKFDNEKIKEEWLKIIK